MIKLEVRLFCNLNPPRRLLQFTEKETLISAIFDFIIQGLDFYNLYNIFQNLPDFFNNFGNEPFHAIKKIIYSMEKLNLNCHNVLFYNYFKMFEF